MRQCIIFCAGGLEQPVESIPANALLIAADGGLLHTQRLGLTPDIILGDFDSLGYIPAQGQVFPVEKDDTDALLAIKKGLSLGCKEFLIYGGLDGVRLDHTVANLQALQFLADHDAVGTLIGNHQIVTLLQSDSLTFPEKFEGTLSVFAMGKPAEGVTLHNLQYLMENGSLSPDFPLGVSNHFTGKAATVSVQKGSLLLIWQRENGLPDKKQ